MNGRMLIVFLGVVVVVVGFFLLTMLDEGGGPSDVVEPVAEESETGEVGTGSGPELRPTINEVEPDVATGPERETQPGEEPYDPTGVLVVTGKVTARKTGKPVDEAEVEILYPDGDEFVTVTTAEDGTYRMEVNQGIPAVVDFRATADGFATQARQGMRIARSTRALTVDFELETWFRIEGRVTSARDGSPVVDADVEIRSRIPMYSDGWDDAETDANGFYRIDDIEEIPREGFDVWVDSVSHSPAFRNDLRIEPGSDVLVVDFVLWEELKVRGTVVSAQDGLPIEDAMVSGASADPEFIDDGEDELTEEDGTFELQLDSVPYEDIFILVSADDHAPVRIDPVPPPGPDGVIQLGKIALGSLVHLTGTVVNKVTGRPVNGGDISVYSTLAPDHDEGEFADSELIDDTGRFELDLELTPADEAEILVEADGFFPLRKPLQLTPNVMRHNILLEVEPVITMRGVIRRQVDHSAVAGARIRLLGGTESVEEDSVMGRSRADGSYVLELPAGDASRFGVVIEYGDLRFPSGKLPSPRPGTFEILKDFTVDIPPFGRGNR